jgi:hypothetical protein
VEEIAQLNDYPNGEKVDSFYNSEVIGILGLEVFW